MASESITDPAIDSAELLASSTVSEFATIGIHTVSAEAPLDEVAWMMATNRVHAIVVADTGLSEPPVIADTDLISAATTGQFGGLRASDIAASEPVSVNGDESLARAAQLLAEHGVSHLVVRDGRGLPAGILSSLDVARAISRSLAD